MNHRVTEARRNNIREYLREWNRGATYRFLKLTNFLLCASVPLCLCGSFFYAFLVFPQGTRRSIIAKPRWAESCCKTSPSLLRAQVRAVTSLPASLYSIL